MKGRAVCAKESPTNTKSLLLCRYGIILVLLFLTHVRLGGQNNPEFYEISVNLEIQRVGGTEVDAVINGREIYLSVTQLFDFLKIKNTPSQDLESVSGFYINPDTEYAIDKKENQIRLGDKTFTLEPEDLVRTESNLYLRSPQFSTVFGLECIFDYRTLSVRVETKLDLPLIREMRQEEMRKNLSIIKGDVEADTVVGRRYPVFKFGMADWSVIATEELGGE